MKFYLLTDYAFLGAAAAFWSFFTSCLMILFLCNKQGRISGESIFNKPN